MHNFKDFGIISERRNFEGDKIPMHKILNKQIVIEDFKITDSKFKDKGSGKLLTMQIIVDNNKRILFTGSANLMNVIEQIDKNKFPFMATIVEEHDRLEFT